ncbi:hypothetical protein H2198_002711 [Neophaeococcomyces mojaviensis]|uniref:Uncharacterized protein n=1 Tax=Neophaeococcomyces mojaviensis TaxID=3383035 RepID=A0ACC3ADY9_9EURO|nr:hypothetical protein H2198_002711 [Knufia sp. JES_112]
MAITSGSQYRTSSSRRHTWPRAQVQQLETIPESPRSSPKKDFSTSLEPSSTGEPQRQDDELSTGEPKAELRNVIPEAIRTQMLWYSHHLAQSYQDRERLASKISELENVCKSQSKANAALQRDIRVWQQNYESIENELIEAAQEIEEAKAYVRCLETANANVRYALSQAREEQEQAKQRRWGQRLQRPWRRCFRWTSMVKDAVLRLCSCTNQKQHHEERPPARQALVDKSRSVTPENEVNSSQVQLLRSRVPSTMSRSSNHERTGPLSSHPTPEKLDDEEDTT